MKMSKKNKKNKNQVFMDPYEAAMYRAQNDIETADYSIDEVELDENGDPIEPEYEYEEAPKKKEQVLTPSYMAYLMGGIKEPKKKKQKKSYDGDYDLDLINDENSDINIEDALNHVAKQANAEYAKDHVQTAQEEDPYMKALVEPTEEHSDTTEDEDSDQSLVSYLFPQEFNNESEDNNGVDEDGFFGNPLDYVDEEDDVENADSSVYNSDDFGIGVGVSAKSNEESTPDTESDVNYDTVKINDDAEDKPSMTATDSEIYFRLSKICSLKFNIFEELGRMNINDGIVQNPVIDTVLNLDCYYVNQEGVYNHFLGEDGKLDLKLLAETQRGLWTYIISSKHPAAVYTVPEFLEAFKTVRYLDTKNFQFVMDDHDNEDIMEPMIYAYHIPASEQRKFNNYVKHAAVGFTNSENFYPELNSSYRGILAEFIVYCNISATIRNDREIFARHIPEYMQAFRFASKKMPDGSTHPAYNQIIEFTELVHRHRKTEVGKEEFTFEDLDGIFSIDDYDQIRDLVFDILEIVDGDADDYDDDDVPYAVLPENGIVDAASEEDEEDPMDALATQASDYAKDTTDYSQYLTEPQTVEETVDDLTEQLYDRYVATAKENHEEVLSKEELASRMKQNVTGAMSMVQNTDGSAKLTSTTVTKTETETVVPNVESVPAVDVRTESRSEDVGSNAMREALLKCGARPSNTTSETSGTKKSMVIPVVRK